MFPRGNHLIELSGVEAVDIDIDPDNTMSDDRQRTNVLWQFSRRRNKPGQRQRRNWRRRLQRALAAAANTPTLPTHYQPPWTVTHPDAWPNDYIVPTQSYWSSPTGLVNVQYRLVQSHYYPHPHFLHSPDMETPIVAPSDDITKCPTTYSSEEQLINMPVTFSSWFFLDFVILTLGFVLILWISLSLIELVYFTLLILIFLYSFVCFYCPSFFSPELES
jgi:hypothetical protein